MVPSLLETSAETLAQNINNYEALEKIPEELVLYIFERVLQLGKLTPRSLRVFASTNLPGVLARIRALNLQDPPPIIKDTRNPWLGQKPSLY